MRCLTCDIVIERHNAQSADEIVACGKCGWRIPWSTYHQSYRNKQLFGANVVGIFETYHSVFPRAQTAREKMVLIDQLIHAFHMKLTDIGRPVAANLIQGSLKEVIHFLDRLSSRDASTAGIGDSRTAWRQTLAAADWSQAFVGKNDDPGGMVQE